MKGQFWGGIRGTCFHVAWQEAKKQRKEYSHLRKKRGEKKGSFTLALTIGRMSVRFETRTKIDETGEREGRNFGTERQNGGW